MIERDREYEREKLRRAAKQKGSKREERGEQQNGVLLYITRTGRAPGTSILTPPLTTVAHLSLAVACIHTHTHFSKVHKSIQYTQLTTNL